MIKIHYPTTPIGMAFGMPINSAVDRVLETARELDAAAKNGPGKRDDAGQRLIEAVKRRLGKRCQTSHTITADADNESFGEKLKNAVQKKLGQRARR